MRSDHIPSSPSIAKRCLIAHRVGRGRPDGITLLVRQHRKRHESRHASRNCSGIVADETEIDLALKSWRALLLLIERIENRSQIRIDGSELEQLAALHVSHVDVVIEIKSTRTARSDLCELKAGL